MIFLQVFFYGLLSAAATVLADYLSFQVRCNTGEEAPAPPEVIPLDKEPLLEEYPIPKCFEEWIHNKGLK